MKPKAIPSSDETKSPANVAPLRKARDLAPSASARRTASTIRSAPTAAANVDLNRWLTGSYAIPVADDESKPNIPRGLRTAAFHGISVVFQLFGPNDIFLSKNSHLTLAMAEQDVITPLASGENQAPSDLARERWVEAGTPR
jgi:hypothetical protein